MTIQEAMRARHTVRRYTGRRLPEVVVQALRQRMEAHNREGGLLLTLAVNNREAFGPALRLFFARGVRNYIVLAGKDRPGLEEDLGWYGADLMLFAQTLGLNTWWAGGTYSRKGAERNAHPEAEKILGILAVGYGAAQGTPHRSKGPEEIAAYEGPAPEWFTRGVEAVLLAPTALNRQAFIIRGEGRKVSMACAGGAFSGVDLGIGRYHFQAGAGAENFEWA